MKAWLIVLAVAAMALPARAADEDPRMADLHGNTLFVHLVPEGTVFKVYFNDDETYYQTGPLGLQKGRNWFEGNNLCHFLEGAKSKFCHYFGSPKPGSSWSVKEVRGGIEHTVSFTLLKGRQ